MIPTHSHGPVMVPVLASFEMEDVSKDPPMQSDQLESILTGIHGETVKLTKVQFSRANNNRKRRFEEVDVNELAEEVGKILETVSESSTISAVLEKMLMMIKKMSDGINMLLERSDQENPIEFNVNKRSLPTHSIETQIFTQDTKTSNSGKGQAALKKKTYSQVAASKVVGRRMDTLELVPLQMEKKTVSSTSSSIPKQSIAQKTIDRLTWNPKPPQHHAVAVLRYSKMAPRRSVNAKEWKNILKEQQIFPYAVLHPHPTTIEIVVPHDQVEKTRTFLSGLDRQEEDPNPYARRDGETTALSQPIIQRYVANRIQMLNYERSIIAARYLEESIRKGIKMLSIDLQGPLYEKLQDLVQMKSMMTTQQSVQKSSL